MAHHYVFQRYLEYFSPDENNVFQYEKSTAEEKFLPIISVASINDYYTYFPGSGEKNTSFENPFLSNFEGLYPELITSLEKQEPLAPHHDYLISAMAIMHARVPKQRNHLDSVVRDLHRKAPSLGEPSKNLDLELMVMLMKLYANIMSKSYFWIGIAQDDAFFITSDNPAGNACLPLTPKICLFSSNEEKSEDYFSVDKEFVEKINRIIYENADRYIFAHTSIKPLFE